MLLTVYKWLSVGAMVLLVACAPQIVTPDKDAPVAGVYSLQTIEMAYLGPVLKNTKSEVELTTEMAQNSPEKSLPVLESQLTTSNSFPQMPKADCAIETFDRKGGEFTAAGQCRTKGVRLGTRFLFSGNNTADAFTILLTMFPEEEGVTPASRRMTISGTLGKAPAAR